jgi:N-acetylneuraminate synthase
MKIEHREITTHYQPYFVAEIGISHMGDFSKAIQSIETAARCGANAVKFQHHLMNEMVEDHPWRETISKCLLTLGQQGVLMEYARENGLHYICTPFCTKALQQLILIEPDAIKIGSGEVSNMEMMEVLASEWCGPVIISTGMHDTEECNNALKIIQRDNLIVLHCISKYPTLPIETDLVGRKGCGFSMHSPSGQIGPGIAACALGYPLIECHVNFTGCGGTPDSAVEQNELDFADLIDYGIQAWEATGRYKYADEVVRNLAKHFPVAKEDIEQGDPFAGKIEYKRAVYNPDYNWTAKDHLVLQTLVARTSHKKGEVITCL